MSLSDIPYIIIGIIFIICEESQNHTYSDLLGEQLRKFKEHKQAIKEAPFLFTKPDYMYPKRNGLLLFRFLPQLKHIYLLYMLFGLFFAQHHYC